MMHRKGFTLIEIIVIVAILAVLAGIAIPNFGNAYMAARGSKILADMNSCESAVNIYYIKTGTFPSEINALVPFYLAVWPQAPAGKALVRKYDNNDLILDVQTSSYVYVQPVGGSELNTRVGRITLGGKTIDDLLSTSASSLILSDG